MAWLSLAFILLPCTFYFFHTITHTCAPFEGFKFKFSLLFSVAFCHSCLSLSFSLSDTHNRFHTHYITLALLNTLCHSHFLNFHSLSLSLCLTHSDVYTFFYYRLYFYLKIYHKNPFSLSISLSHLHNLSLSLLFYVASHIYTFFYYYTLYFYLFILQCIFKNISFFLSLSLTYLISFSLLFYPASHYYTFFYDTLYFYLCILQSISKLFLSLSLTQSLSLSLSHTHTHTLLFYPAFHQF